MKLQEKFTLVMLGLALLLAGMFMVDGIIPAQAQHYVPRPAFQGQELLTDGKPWVNLRTAATETQAAGFAWTTGNPDFYDIVGNTSTNPSIVSTYIVATNGVFDVWDELGWGTNAVTIAFYSAKDGSGNDEDDTFDFELYAFANNSNYGPMLPVYITTGNANIVGTGECAYQPVSGASHTTLGRWVDTISGTDTWPVGVTVADSTTNRICTITFDMMGNRYLYLLIFGSGGGASEAGEIGAIIRGY